MSPLLRRSRWDSPELLSGGVTGRFDLPFLQVDGGFSGVGPFVGIASRRLSQGGGRREISGSDLAPDLRLCAESRRKRRWWKIDDLDEFGTPASVIGVGALNAMRMSSPDGPAR